MLTQAIRRFFTTTTANQSLQILTTKLTQKEAGIYLVELNNPKTKNALSKKLIVDLKNAIDTIQADQNAKVAILRSKLPDMFCAGADLKERKNMTQFETEQFVISLRDTFNQFSNLPIPTIACIDGPALGGGLELALSCDMRISSKKSIIGLVETALAIIPGAGGTQNLPRTIGIVKAKELIFTAQRLSAQEAKDYGILNYVQDDYNDVYRKALEIAQKIMKNGPVAVRLAKTAINYGMQTDLKTGLEIEKMLYSKIITTEDRTEGLKAFSEKRKPVYKGK